MSTYPMRRVCACAALLAAAAPALAMPPTAPEQADTQVPALEYRPAFDDYTPFRQTELADWRSVNDAVGSLGGHTGHRQPDTTADHDRHVQGYVP